jgi:hypothetical protein
VRVAAHLGICKRDVGRAHRLRRSRANAGRRSSIASASTDQGGDDDHEIVAVDLARRKRNQRGAVVLASRPVQQCLQKACASTHFRCCVSRDSWIHEEHP